MSTEPKEVKTEAKPEPVKPEPKESKRTAKKGRSVYEKLLEVQRKISVPKNLYNSYGGYYYRNAETILETVKPQLEETGALLTLEDDIVAVGDSLFVKAMAQFIDLESGEKITTSAFAKLSDHKGMSGDQETGCASSYARKYCLNGLFLLDDIKDADTDEFAKQTGKEAKGTTSRPTWEKKSEEKPASGGTIKW